jgi:hypothetical protein
LRVNSTRVRFSAFFSCDLKDFTHTGKRKWFFKHVQRNQKIGTAEEPGLCRPDRGGGVELPYRNGPVPDEDERYGHHEVRRVAKRVWVRKPQTAQDDNDHEGRTCPVLLALVAARPRVPGASERKRGARITVGSEPAQVSREEQEKSPSLPLPGVR